LFIKIVFELGIEFLDLTIFSIEVVYSIIQRCD